MNIQAVANSEQIAAGNQLYQVREQHKERPRCAECGVKLLLVRIRDGKDTCYRHDRGEELVGKRTARTKLRTRELDGPPAPRGTGLTLKMARLKAGLNQHDVAAEVGVGKGTLFRWETQKRAVPVKAAREIAKVIERLQA